MPYIILDKNIGTMQLMLYFGAHFIFNVIEYSKVFCKWFTEFFSMMVPM